MTLHKTDLIEEHFFDTSYTYVACLATVDAVFSVKIFQPLVSSPDLHFLLFNVKQHFVLLQFSANVRSKAVLAGLF